ncbi:hypothetical protein WJU23_20340 [Prosthecobacter sp. SYSU 5D2]|uniref:hypothetical protein n=1 Tax=Prosthecobacter sp. SYSU 5D2 TaxID=3134134 RepID=UPI0031FEF8F7
MTDFNNRWQTLSQNARQAPLDPAADLPHGFATRVLALARQPSHEAWEEVLTVLGLRAVLATGGLFLLSASLTFSDWFDTRLEPPALELTFLSDLTWP